MTQRTINLYDGLEVLYYFDPTYFDGTKDEIKDKSGHERHASAVGGPTIGVEGPDDFGATGFDGSDDVFNTGERLGSADGFTAFVLWEADEIIDDYRYGVIGNYSATVGGWAIAPDEFGNLDTLFVGGEGGYNGLSKTTGYEPGVWYSTVYKWDGSTLSISVNGVTMESAPRTDHSTATSNLKIGNTKDANPFNGSVAVAGVWHRAVNEAETQQLHRLTAPRRQLL